MTFDSIFLSAITVVWMNCAALLGSLHAEDIGDARLPSAQADLSQQLADQVSIYRDAYGVPHIFGHSDESVIFGFAFAQAEDNFWQLEDSYILALGRYSEVLGPLGMNSDRLNRAFEIVPRSQSDFEKLDATTRSLCTAFVAGINHFLAKHPNVRPRLIHRFEPWHVLAFHRHVTLELCFRYTHLSDSFLPRNNEEIWAATGSNAWAISGKRTASGGPLLLVNPHMPFYGFAQLYEAHFSGMQGHEGQPWSFTGATFLGSPVLTIGHNEQLGWTMTTNEPDIADVWRIRFSDPGKPLQYDYDAGTRTATRWQETIRVRSGVGYRNETYVFRRTHHGPVVGKVDETTYLAARISGLYDVVPMRQSMAMMKARSISDFKTALALLQMPFMNVVYADRAGNLYYLYGARAPRRDPALDWSKPVDGGNPQCEWLGVHGIDELPQVLNPESGYLQNCNSSPFITTDGENPKAEDFPPYLIEDAQQFKRRALRSLEILRTLENATLDDVVKLAFDTKLYWAEHEMPKLLNAATRLGEQQRELAAAVAPLIEILSEWDGRITTGSTAATLATAWYEEMYGTEYPGETMLAKYQGNPSRQMRALLTASESLQRRFGDAQVPYGRVYRQQRQAYTADLLALRFNDRSYSLPMAAGHGPMGVIFTQYYTPSIHIPLIYRQQKRYGVIGPAYLAVYEFAPDGVRGKSLVPYGSSGNPSSRHYFDQAKLLSNQKMKPMLFERAEVKQQSVRSYAP